MKKILFGLVGFLILISMGGLAFIQLKDSKNPPKEEEPGLQEDYLYHFPQIAPAEAYTIILVGDSMTKALGPNTDSLREYLSSYYPNKVFGIFNYGIGSTNILSLQERLENYTFEQEQVYPPILEREFDLIIIESFGHNPLSQFPLEEGLKKQTEALDRAVESLMTTHPKSGIVFLATIAPSKSTYGQGAVELAGEQRQKWAEERIAYIENYIGYANSHNIPLINVYQASLNILGEVKIAYVNSDDNIHPSGQGIDLISREIADFIFENHLLILK